MPKIFVSYRRSDSHVTTKRIYDRLVQEFGLENIFLDTVSIPSGSDYRVKLQESFLQTDVLLVIIGQDWLSVTNKSRLNDPDDFVRLEIQGNLKRDDCLVIPLLIDGASMPDASTLPVELRELAFRNAAQIRVDPDFDSDLRKLIASIKRRFPEDRGNRFFNFLSNIPISVNTLDDTPIPEQITDIPTLEQITDMPHTLNDIPRGQDALGFADYAKVFAEIVSSKDIRPPLTIGIYGGWGSGKSFLLSQIKSEINASDDTDEHRGLWRKIISLPKRLLRWMGRSLRLSSRNVVTIDFNAWSYNASDVLWAGLVKQIFETIESQLGWYGGIVTLRRNLQKEWRRFARRLLYIIIFAIVVGIVLIVILLQFDQTELERIIPILASVASMPLLLELGRQLVSLATTPQSQQISAFMSSDNYDKERGLMARIYEDMDALVSALPKHIRLAIFIDDLDRCKPERAIEVLEAINLLLSFDIFIVFLAIDTRIIASVIETAYDESLERANVSGYEYLDKIIQIPFAIPHARPNELVDYLNLLFEADADEKDIWVYQSVETTEDSQESEVEHSDPSDSPDTPPSDSSYIPPSDSPDTSESQNITIVAFTSGERKIFRAFAPFIDPNPRRIKRLVNVYRLVRLLAQRKNMPFVEDEPAKLILWLILCQQWPTIATYIINNLNRGGNQFALSNVLEILDMDSLEEFERFNYQYKRLQDLVDKYGDYLTNSDIRQMLPFTVNFNPALSPEIHLFLKDGATIETKQANQDDSQILKPE